MNKIKLSLLIAGIAVGQTVGAKAQFTSVQLGTTPTSVNLNNYPAFAFYGNNAATPFSTPVAGTVSTDLLNVGNFIGVQLVGTGALVASGPHDSVPVSYTGGQTANAPTTGQTSATADQIQSLVTGGTNGSGVSTTSTLFAPTETFQFYLASSDTAVDFTLSLATGSGTAVGTPFTLSDQVLPTTNSFTGGGDSTGAGSKDGLLTFTVTGAIGDVLTYSQMINTAGVSNASNPNTGLFAADVVTAVPEATTWAMLLGGFGLLAGLQRFRKLA